MLRTFIQTCSLSLTLEAAVFLAKGNLGLSAEVIARLSLHRWEHNSSVIKNLAMQRADTWIGVILLFVAFALQMTNLLWPLRFADFEVSSTGALAAIAFSILVFGFALLLSRRIAARTEAEVQQILQPENQRKV